MKMFQHSILFFTGEILLSTKGLLMWWFFSICWLKRDWYSFIHSFNCAFYTPQKNKCSNYSSAGRSEESHPIGDDGSRRHEPWPHQLPIKPSLCSPPHTVTTGFTKGIHSPLVLCNTTTTTMFIKHVCWSVSWHANKVLVRGLLTTKLSSVLTAEWCDVTQPVTVYFLWRCTVCIQWSAVDCLFDSAPCATITCDHTKRKLCLTQQHSLFFEHLMLILFVPAHVWFPPDLPNVFLCHSNTEEELLHCCFNVISTTWVQFNYLTNI